MKIDLIGKRSGLIKIISYSEQRKNKNHYWNYKCECGKTGVISSAEFKRCRTKIKSCGCYVEEKSISGNKYSNLTAIRYVYTKNKKRFWLCRCDCGRKTSLEKYLLTSGRTKTCGKCWYEREDYITKRKKVFYSNIIKQDDGCWIWNGRKSWDGYGTYPAASIDQRAHRASYKLHKGEVLKGMCVLHKCDVKLCVNPDHLYIGTVKDNVRDALERGQFPKGPNPKKAAKNPRRGESISSSKLKNSDIKNIRQIYIPFKFSMQKIANIYGVDIKTIQNILTCKSWRHI